MDYGGVPLLYEGIHVYSIVLEALHIGLHCGEVPLGIRVPGVQSHASVRIGGFYSGLRDGDISCTWFCDICTFVGSMKSHFTRATHDEKGCQKTALLFTILFSAAVSGPTRVIFRDYTFW